MNLHAPQHHNTAHIRPTLLLLGLILAGVISYWATEPTAQAQGTQPVSPLICFGASNLPGQGIMLAWRSTLDDGAAFTLARAQFTSPLGQIRGPLINQADMPHLSAREQQADGEEWRYTQIDGNVENGIKYAYTITATFVISDVEQVAFDEETWTYDGDLETTVRNDDLCLSTNTVVWTSTPTPLATATVTRIPTDTGTPTHTATPTWTPTPTFTFTPSSTLTWTPEPPGPTKTPFPTPTFTPSWTFTPEPATPTITPTFTETPTFTPAVSTPTAQPGANPGAVTDPIQQQQQNPPLDNSSPLPTPDWTPTWTPTWTAPAMEAINASPLETPLPGGPSAPASTSPEAESAASAASSAEVSAAPLQDTAENRAVAATQPLQSEFDPSPVVRDRADNLRLALYGVGGLAVVAALAFFLGLIALFGGRQNPPRR